MWIQILENKNYCIANGGDSKITTQITYLQSDNYERLKNSKEKFRIHGVVPMDRQESCFPHCVILFDALYSGIFSLPS